MVREEIRLDREKSEDTMPLYQIQYLEERKA